MGLLTQDGSTAHKTPYRLTDTGKHCLAIHGQFVDALDLPALVADATVE